MGRGQITVVNLCKPEIGQFNSHVRTVIFEEQILGFYVTVGYTVVVTML